MREGMWVQNQIVEDSFYFVPLAWYVKPLRRLGSFGHFLLDWKLGFDLGKGIVPSARDAWRWREFSR